jgi:membrane protein
LLVAVVRGLFANDMPHLAAGLAYYAIFSMFPLVLGFLAILGLSLQSQNLQPRFLEFVSQSVPGASNFIADNISQIVRFHNAVGVGAIIGLFWLGRAVFAAVTRAINRSWGITRDPPFYLALPQQIGMMVALGSLQLLSTIGTSLIQIATSEAITIFGREPLLGVGVTYLSLHLVPLLLTAVTFGLMYRFVPNRPMRWAYVWPGVAGASLLFEGAKILFVIYLERFANYTLLYGSMASVMVFMFWAYVSSIILLGGALTCSHYQRLFYPNQTEYETLA